VSKIAHPRETGDSIMTALMKYLAVLGFAGELSLAATSSFAPRKSRSLERCRDSDLV
jgi:hypothetical protein